MPLSLCEKTFDTEVKVETIKNYQNLANAIIIRAVEDWRDAVRRLKRKPNNKQALEEKESCEDFFLSDWFDILTSVRGEDLLRKLKEEAGID